MAPHTTNGVTVKNSDAPTEWGMIFFVLFCGFWAVIFLLLITGFFHKYFPGLARILMLVSGS